MEPPLCSEPAVLQTVLVLLSGMVPLFRGFALLMQIGLEKTWKEFSFVTPAKKKKAALNLTKVFVYLFICLALLPMSIRIFKEWERSGFFQPIPEFWLGYVRIIASVVAAFYIHELSQTEKPSLSMWVHHTFYPIGIALIVGGTTTGSKNDLLYLIYTATFIAQFTFLNFVFTLGHVVAQVWEDSMRKVELLQAVATYSIFVTLATQTIIWIRFIASVSYLSSWVPYFLTVLMSAVTAGHMSLSIYITYAMADKVRRRILEKDEKGASEKCNHGRKLS